MNPAPMGYGKIIMQRTNYNKLRSGTVRQIGTFAYHLLKGKKKKLRSGGVNMQVYINSSGPITKSILQQYDDDVESSYFRRKPTSFLSNSSGASGGGGGGGTGPGSGGAGLIIGSSATLPAGDSKRYGGSWLPAEDEAVRLEGPR
ncbi:hypothetical protein ZHAS_00013152 [Anopheles sinensis]|uniref:Uncharacterized protein n=1 Tax=Anopheles sinensis TaxID=74873 RepID=A0A084W4I6_ANOSI|nr:hypothetical protein ZHAS_00013152 [Anopheles sinensis]